MSFKQLEPAKFMIYSSSSRQRNSTISPNMDNNRRIGDYLLLSTIGSGTFSKVKLGLHLPTRQKVAIKILDQEKIVDETDIERIKREIRILSILHHKNIVQLYETLSYNNNIYIIMEYIEGKDLFQYIYSLEKLTEYKASQLFRQLISCLEYIHKLGIVHRDIKPENILLDKSKKNLKLVDFGLGNIYKKNELVKTACGSPCYAAPEMLSGHAYDGFYSDLWSCGVVLYCMLVGSLPFDDEDIKVLYDNIKKAKYEMPNFLSAYAQDLLKRILVTNPKQRIKLDEIKSHPFLKMSEKINICREIMDEGGGIFIDNDIVQKMKMKFFKDDENISCEFIVNNIENNLHNKITTIYYLMCKSRNDKEKKLEKNKNINDNQNEKDNNNNIINNNQVIINEKENQNLESEKNPSFVKFADKIDKNLFINEELSREEKNEENKLISIENDSRNKNNQIIKMHNIKKILFNDSKKVSKKNTINRNETESLFDNNKKENITFNNDNNEKNFNILVINNFMQEKQISKVSTLKPVLNHNKKVNNNTGNKIIKKVKSKKNCTPKINVRNRNRYGTENIKLHGDENSINSNNSKYGNYLKNVIINRIVNCINKNSRKMKKLHSVNYYQKMRLKTSPNNIKNNNINLSLSINNTINNNINHKKYVKEISYNNTNKSKNNNKIVYYNNITENKNNNKILGINTHNVRPFQKCKKINFDSLDTKSNEPNLNYINLNINNAIKNENIHRQKYLVSKMVNSKEKKSNKSINLGHNQRVGNNKFKKYMNKLLEQDSFNKENIKNKTMNLTPILQHHINMNNYLKNKIEKTESTKNKVNNGNKNMFPIKFDYNLIKKNKITNLFEYYRTNGLKQYMQKNNNIINNLNKKTNNINNMKYINNNNNNLKNKYDFDEKLSDYMKKRFNNYIKKANTNISHNKKNKNHNLYNLYLNSKNSNNNTNIYGEKSSISPNSIANKGENKLYLNKSYIKNNNNKMIFNKISKKTNNSSKNDRINKNNRKNNNNILLQVNFNNIVRKNISSKNKNTKNRNNVNLTTYNSIINHNELKNTYKLNFNKNNNNNGYKTSYHSRDKSKNETDFIQYSQINKNNNNNNLTNKHIMNINIYENNINKDININNSELRNKFYPYYFENKKYGNNDFGNNNINLI